MIKTENKEDLRKRAAETLGSLGPGAAALELFRLLVEVDGQSATNWFNYGDCLQSVGRLAEAEKSLLTARKLAPEKQKHTDARLAIVASKRGAQEDAERRFEQTTKDQQCPGWVWVLRAVNLINLELMPLAGECLKAARERGSVDFDEVTLPRFHVHQTHAALRLLSKSAGDR